MNKYGRFAKFKTKPGKKEEFTAILLEVSTKMNAKGLRHFIIYDDLNTPDCVCVSEIWDSKADHGASLKMAENMESIAKAMPLLDGKPESTELSVMGGVGID